MDERAHQYQLSVSGIPGLTLHKDMDIIEVESGGVMELPVRLPADDAALLVREDARFLGPQ